jgi:geranylgeranyl transferase type-1 subunit beta
VGWLASRQTDKLLGEEDGEEEEEVADNDNEEEPTTAEVGGRAATESVDDLIRGLSNMTPLSGATISCAGFNGRCNKLADTCYSFWNGAALKVCLPITLNRPHAHQVYRCWIGIV